MTTPRILLEGAFFDTQLYAGRLYLWGRDRSLSIVNWDRLVDSIQVPDRLKVALTCAYRRSEYLYGDGRDSVFADAEIKQLLLGKFDALAASPISISKYQLQSFTERQQDNPLPFPHADCTIYGKVIYAGSRSTGLASAPITKSKRTPVGPRAETLWGGPVLGISASYSALALSAGSEGLIEYSLEPANSQSRQHLRPLITTHSSSTRWLFGSLFSSSHVVGGQLADYVRPPRNPYGQRSADPQEKRLFREVVQSDQIFGQNADPSITYTWGVQEKICRAMNGAIHVAPYSYNRDTEDRFGEGWTLQVPKLRGSIVNADSALFGFVVELDNGLLVVESSREESIWLEGEPVNWRVFPKSKFYTNQLHVVHEDHVAIYSFNQDYFVDQREKRAGISHRQEPAYFRAA